MSRIREGQLFKNIAMKKRKATWIRGRKDSSHLSLGTVHNHINKESKNKVNLIL
jgi:hypothetical protein